MILALWAALAAAADCPEDPSRALRDGATLMAVNFAALDEEGFDLSRAQFDAALPCLTAPVDLATAIAMHRAMALAEFADGDMVAVRKSFGAIRQLDPEWRVPATLVQPGHLLHTLYDEAPTGMDRVDLDLAPDGGWQVDATPSSTVPAQVAFVLQGFGKEGEVVYTGYHTSVADIPVLDFAAPGMSPRSRRMRILGTTVGGGVVLLGAGLIGLGQVSKGNLSEVPYERLPGAKTRAEAMGVGGVALAVAGAGLGTAVWIVRW